LEGHGPIIALDFLGGHNPNHRVGISGGDTPRLFHWDFGRASPHNFVGIFGGNNPQNYAGDGSIIDATVPFRGPPKARQSFSPMVAASAATLGMGIAEIATLKALHQSGRIVVRRIKPMHRGDFPHPG
jgi:hypothetical protein